MFSSDKQESDVCHVGSALFMGNNIRMMCSNQVDTLQQTVWTTVENESVSGYSTKREPITYRYSYIGYDENCPFELISTGNTSGEKYLDTTETMPGREDWIAISQSMNYDNISKILESVGADGKSTGLLVKFNNYKKNKWQCGDKPSASARGIASYDTLSRAIKSNKEKDIALDGFDMGSLASSKEIPMMRGDSPGGGGGHSPPDGGGGGSSGGSCFTAGTPILLSDGTTKSIEKMEKGDLVLSYNEESGENQVCQVEETMAH